MVAIRDVEIDAHHEIAGTYEVRGSYSSLIKATLHENKRRITIRVIEDTRNKDNDFMKMQIGSIRFQIIKNNAPVDIDDDKVLIYLGDVDGTGGEFSLCIQQNQYNSLFRRIFS